MTFGVKPGDLWQMGDHRLMCGDAGNNADVALLMRDVSVNLVFTSPPYLQQRVYENSIACWDQMMVKVFASIPDADGCQVLVNLGLVHNRSEWAPYWEAWVADMRQRGWRRFGWYVWDKMEAMPGNRNGRLSPSFEFIFHFNKKSVQAAKIVPCKRAGKWHSKKARGISSGGRWQNEFGDITNSHKIMDGTLRIAPEKCNRWGHPAVFPIALPKQIILSYSQPTQVIYDPFLGSGTSVLASEQTGRVCYGMEVAPKYCEMALTRWDDHYPSQKAVRVGHGDG